MSSERIGSRETAFSLIEVLISVGIFAGAIVAILGLLGPSLLATREVIDSTVAASIADSIDMEMKRLERDSDFGFVWMKSHTEAEQKIVLFGVQDGSQIVIAEDADKDPITGNPRGIAQQDRYFRIVVRQLDAPASSDGFLALSIRAEWPYATLAGGEVSVSERRSFSFNAALRR